MQIIASTLSEGLFVYVVRRNQNIGRKFHPPVNGQLNRVSKKLTDPLAVGVSLITSSACLTRAKVGGRIAD